MAFLRYVLIDNMQNFYIQLLIIEKIFLLIFSSLPEGISFTYTIQEPAGSAMAVTYDDSVYTADLTVTDDGDGHLGAGVICKNVECVYF